MLRVLLGMLWGRCDGESQSSTFDIRASLFSVNSLISIHGFLTGMY